MQLEFRSHLVGPKKLGRLQHRAQLLQSQKISSLWGPEAESVSMQTTFSTFPYTLHIHVSIYSRVYSNTLWWPWSFYSGQMYKSTAHKCALLRKDWVNNWQGTSIVSQFFYNSVVSISLSGIVSSCTHAVDYWNSDSVWPGLPTEAYQNRHVPIHKVFQSLRHLLLVFGLFEVGVARPIGLLSHTETPQDYLQAECKHIQCSIATV